MWFAWLCLGQFGQEWLLLWSNFEVAPSDSESTVCWPWAGNETQYYQCLSLPTFPPPVSFFFPCLFNFGLHKIFQGIVIILWWLRVPAPVRAGHIWFWSSCSQGTEANFLLRLAPLRSWADSCWDSPESRLMQGLQNDFHRKQKIMSCSYLIPSMAT